VFGCGKVSKETPETWKSVSLATGYSFSCILFTIFSVLNIIHYVNGSTAAMSFSVYFTLLALWVCVLVPFTLLGGFISAGCDEPLEFPIRMTENRRKIPAGPLYKCFLCY